MTWHAAPCVSLMLHEANEAAPERDKSSDGIIASSAHHHQNPTSDHEADSRGIVHAIDLTQDPVGGWSCAARCEALRKAQDVRIKYVIFDRRWFHGADADKYGHVPWTWEPYHGASAHTEHMHVSVRSGDIFENNVSPWWGGEGDDMTPEQEKKLDRVIELLTESRLDSSGHTKTMEATDILERKINGLAKYPGKVLTFHDDGTVKTVDGNPV